MPSSPSLPADDSSRISPTAHYTAYAWYHHGLSHPALVTRRGQTLFFGLRPLNLLLERIGHPTLDGMLLARHRAIDSLLEGAIASGAIGQVLEVAAGFSPRGLKLAGRHAGLRYVEADLPAQAAAKRRLLDDAGLRAPRHLVVPIDALRDGGEGSLDDVAARHLDPTVGTAIVTEGLLSYFDRGAVEGMWRRFARCLSRFPAGLYLSDITLAGDIDDLVVARAFRRALGVFARGRVHVHYRDEVEATEALRAAGFADPRVRSPSDVTGAGAAGRTVVRIVEARP